MLAIVNHVANAANERKRKEAAHQAAYRIALFEARESKIDVWRDLDADTQRELTLHRLSFAGLEVVDGNMLGFLDALADLFSRKVAISDTEAAAAVNHLKDVIYGQMEYFVNEAIEPIYFTGEA